MRELLVNIVAVLIILWVNIYTLSYGIYTWKESKLGSISVFILSLSAIVIPIYTMFFRR